MKKSYMLKLAPSFNLPRKRKRKNEVTGGKSNKLKRLRWSGIGATEIIESW